MYVFFSKGEQTEYFVNQVRAKDLSKSSGLRETLFYFENVLRLIINIFCKRSLIRTGQCNEMQYASAHAFQSFICMEEAQVKGISLCKRDNAFCSFNIIASKPLLVIN